jgi:hypothetical protein
VEESKGQETNRRRDCLRNLREIAFLLNIVYAFGYALLVYILKNLTSWNPKSDIGYYYLRAAVRITDVLQLHSASAVSINAGARQGRGRWGQVGEEAAILFSVLAITLVLALVFRLIGTIRAHRVSADLFVFITVFFCAPAAYLYVSRVTWQWSNGQSEVAYTFWRSPLLAIFAAELLCFGVLFIAYRVLSVSRWTVGILIVLHYAFWVVVLWMGIPDWRYRLLTPRLLLFTFPFSGALWLLYSRDSKIPEEQASRKPCRLALASAILSVALLGLLWSPTRAYSILRSQDPRSVRVEMSRGPCYGRCASYSVVIQGTGSVEYVGYRYVRLRNRQTATLSEAQVRQIFQELDRSGFFGIEDRAFAWCFDTPSVEISVSIDGKTKRASSDTFCTGANPGTQATFVQVANEIDEIVGTEQWVKCEGYCRN